MKPTRSRLPNAFAACVACGALALAQLPARGADRAAAAGPLVSITTEVDPSGQNYMWTIENKHTLPITRITFPHYHVDQFIPPPGWSTEGTTNLAMAGNPDEPGVCVATASSAGSGIGAGRTGAVSARISKGGANRRRGAMTVRFSDESQVRIAAGVELPTAPSVGERLVMPLGMVIVFAIIILANSRRRRTSAQAAPAAENPPADA